MPQQLTDAAAIEAEIDRIRSLGLNVLRSEWQAAFGRLSPEALTKDLIARILAYRLQERAFGGLDRESSKLLHRLASGQKPELDLNRRLKPRTVLVREYQGERHTVTVVLDGFVWQEVTYPSLSAIARAITGTAWNGHRFFGLRDADSKAEQSTSAPGNAPRNGEATPSRLHRTSTRSRRG